MVTREDCLRALEDAAEQLGESPTKAAYEALGMTPAASTILRHFEGWNAAKEQAGLGTDASTGSRVEPKPDDVELPDGTAWESLSQDQRWHYRNREWNTERTLERRRGLRRWLHDRKATSGGCTRCDESEPARLDFHHREDADKEMAVNEMVLYGYSKAAIRAELEKCEVLCANCHRQEHHSNPDWAGRIDAAVRSGEGEDKTATGSTLPAADETALDEDERLRAWTHAYKRERGCRRCGETEPVCLQFHHPGDDKSAGVGEMITNSYPEQEVLAEVEKCVVLCANCHRAEHSQNPATGPGGSDRIL